jgi:hypothetical protein
LAYINDRLHKHTATILPAIARYYHCTVELRFEAKSGIVVCKLPPGCDDLAVERILVAAPDAGTRITIVVSGKRRQEACQSVQAILSNLRQCDEWLRQRKSNLAQEDIVRGFLAYAHRIARMAMQASKEKRGIELWPLLSEERLVVYLPSSTLSKEEILHQLVALQSAYFATFDDEEVLRSLWDRERKEPMVLRDGLAVPHASIDAWTSNRDVNGDRAEGG